MTRPRLAVCIPAYSQPQFLQEALTSLCDQGLARDDYIVVVSDDASPEPLAGVVEAFQSRLSLHYHRHERNLGHLANFAAAWQLVDAPFISFLAHDDVVAPGHLGRALAAIADHPQRVLVSSLIVCQSHPGALNTQPHGLLLRGAAKPSFVAPYEWDRAEWMALASVTTPNSIVGSVFRTDAFRKCDGWKAYPIWHDRLMLGEMGLHGSVVTLPWIAGHYRTGAWQLSGKLWQPDMTEFRRATVTVLEWCDGGGIPLADFWVDHICAAPGDERIVYLRMIRASFDRARFLDIKRRCEERLQVRLHLSRLDRLGVPAPIATLLRTVDRLIMRRPA
jgi:glycosyltransferase involved in cell wall biosynthesis